MKFLKEIKNSENIQKVIKFLMLIGIALLIEVFLCNYPAFRTIFVGNQNLEVEYQKSGDTIIIPNLGVRATNIYIEYDNDLTDKITYYLSYIAEEDDGIVNLNGKVILENQKHYIQFDTHSKCETIQLILQTESYTSINKILINHPTFNISIYRILIIVFSILFISKIKNGSIYKELYDSQSRNQNYEFIIILAIICLLITAYTIKQQGYQTLFLKPNEIAVDDAILMQTEAFMNGQIPLLVETSERMLEMENPYNYTQKINNQIPFLYDVAYYDGNYYSYFGITPIITLILPFRVITGMYMHTYVFNLIYTFGIIFLIYDIYKKLVNKFIKKVSLFNFYLGYFAILTASNILTALRGLKYDIVTTSGIMFLLLAISLAMRIGENQKHRKLKLIGIGISTALVVLSKPTYIVYYPLIAFFVWTSIRTFENKQKIKEAIFIAVPLGIFAIIQMIYNYLRFDNILEFGAKYQLTSFNMQYCMSFSIGKVYAGIVEYLFRMPSINLLRFPFVFANMDTTGVTMNEICYENRLIGLIALPILWIFLFSKYILQKENKDLRNIIKISLITTVVAIIINTCTGGICEAYAIDFKCILSICAVILLLKNIELKKDSKEINYLFFILCISTILIMLPLNLTTENNWLSNMASSTTVFIRNIFEFWA